MNTTDFYLQTSEFTELGFYKEFARNMLIEKRMK